MRWLASWVRRHRLLSVLGVGVAGAGIVWLRAGGRPLSDPVQPPCAAARSRPPLADLDTPAMGIPQAEIAAELAREAGSASGDRADVGSGASAQPLPDGSPPSAEYTVKGKKTSMLCHGPSSPYYARTRADVWFRTEQDAVAAGFRAWSRNR